MQYVAQGITDVPFHGADMEKKFEIVKYIDPRFDCNNAAYIDNRYVVVSGGPQISRYESEADENTKDIIRWGNRRTLGSKFLYDSHWYVKYTVYVKINWTSHFNICTDDAKNDPSVLVYKDLFSNNIAFKPFPLTQCTRTIQLKLNDKEISCMPRETLAARMEYWDPKALYKGCNTCPCERPNVQSYFQAGSNVLTNPFRNIQNCAMGEKSNAILPYSQTVFHIMSNANNKADQGGKEAEDCCPLCKNKKAAITLKPDGLEGNKLGANEVYYCTTVTFYEPVLIEPLTFTNGSEFNPPMWNLDNFELTYNVDDLRNMIILDKAAIMKKLCLFYPKDGEAEEAVGKDKGHKFPTGKTEDTEKQGNYDSESDANKDYFVGEDKGNMWKNLVDGISVDFIGKPKLVYYVYTPIPGNEPRLPYMAPYKEFKRYRYTSTEGTINRRDLIDKYNTADGPKEITFDTGRIDMVYYPHSIYLYVAEANDPRTKTVDTMVTHAETFAKITHITCTYGNCTTILDSFKELDFYNISVRNGLKGRAYYDWLITNGNMGKMERYDKYIIPSENNTIAGVGSVVRLTPGIDLHTGGMTGRMIGGCPAVSKSITFNVKAIPLDIFTQGNKQYELYVIFEQQGALVMQDGQCRVGLVGCESVEWYDMQPLAQVTCDYNMYGSEIGGGSFFAKARKVLKKGANIVRKAADHNMFSRGLGALGEITGNDKINTAAQYARKFEGMVPQKKQALMNPIAPPAGGSGFRRRFYN